MILKLLEAQVLRLAAAVAKRRGSKMHAEAARLAGVAATVEASVIELFEASGLRPDIAEIAAKAYAAGWLDALHSGDGATIADAVILRSQGEAVDPAPSRLLN